MMRTSQGDLLVVIKGRANTREGGGVSTMLSGSRGTRSAQLAPSLTHLNGRNNLNLI